MADKLLRCAVYTRKSTEDGLEQEFNSLDAQYEACTAYALSQRHEGWTLVKDRYDDGGFSGGNMERPGLKRLLADVEAGKVDIILLYKIDRLTRSLTDFARIVDILDRAEASRSGRLLLNLNRLAEHFKRRSIVALISDLYENPDELVDTLKPYTYLGNDLVVFHVLDPAEIEFPYQNASRFVDLESGDEVPVVHAPQPANEAAGMRGHRTLPVAFLKPNRFQPRQHFAEDDLSDLTRSIREKGVLQPILVRPVKGTADAFEIVAGERRWRAAQMAKLHDVPVVVRELPDDQALEIAIIENVQRADLSPIEEAAAYKQLTEEPFKRTQDQVAQQVGKSRSHVANTIRLLNLPPQVQAWLREGKLTAGHARTLLGSPDPEAAARDLIEGGLNVRQAEQRSVKKPKPGGKPYKDPNIADLEASISNQLGLKIQIIHKGDKGGEIRISYASLEQLDDVTRRLSRH